MKNIHLLVIEDNYGDFVLIEELLLEENPNFDFTYCPSFSEARLALEKNSHEFDLIFLDLSLKDLKGEELIDSILTICSGIPVVVLTGYEDKNFALKCLSMGVSDYILKDESTGSSLIKTITYNIERVKAKLQLQESEKSYRELFEMSPQPMWVYDFDTYAFLNVNLAAIEQYGYTEEEFLKMTILDIRPAEEHFKVKELVDKTKVSQVGSPLFKGRFQHRKRNGELRDVDVYTSVINFKSKRAGLVLIHDITDNLKHLHAIEEQNSKLQKIAWTQSHIVRAPVSRILGLCNLISMQHASDSQLCEKINYLVESAKELDAVIHDLVKNAEAVIVNPE